MTTTDTIKALRDALTEALSVITDYLEYEHNGDPWTEDARTMGEMEIDDYQRDGRMDAARSALALTADASEDAPGDAKDAKQLVDNWMYAFDVKLGGPAYDALRCSIAARPAPVAATPAPTTRRDIFAICDAYESGIGHGLQLDGHKSGAIFGNPECGKAYEIGYEEGEERARGGKAVAPAAPIAEVKPVAWKRITAPGQAKVGDKLRFNIGDDKFSETVKQILHPGTAREELIYNKRKNYYVITSNAITNFGSSKNVEFLETEHAKPEPVFCTCHICDLCTAMLSQPAVEPVAQVDVKKPIGVQAATGGIVATTATTDGSHVIKTASSSGDGGHAKLAEGPSEREQFEAWWTDNMNLEAMDLHRFADGYACHETNRAWMTWQARGQQAGVVDGARVTREESK